MFKYNTFEEAKKVYLEKAILKGESEDVIEFNALMKFIYEGRREAESNSMEASLDAIKKSMNDICEYCKSWSSDTDYYEKIRNLLQEAKEEIDDRFNTLITAETDRERNAEKSS